jgi:CheY-like chemotaxis protein
MAHAKTKSEKKISLKGYKIIIADNSSVARGIFSMYINRVGGAAITTRDGAAALAIIGKERPNLLVTDIDLPDMNGFDLVAKIRSMKITIPSIIMTTLNIDEYIDLAIEKNIGNILTKEISEEAFVKSCYNIITGKNIFGLDNYIRATGRIAKISINCSSQINPVIRSINAYAAKCGLPADQKPFLAVILDEIISNALYHAHGHTKEKVVHKDVCLAGDEVVEICYCHDRDKLGISVTDYKGTLTKKKILSSFKNVIDQKKLIEESNDLDLDITDKISLTGRGLQMIRLMANDYYFNIKPKSMTQVIALVNISEKAIVYHNSSIRIHEVV